MSNTTATPADLTNNKFFKLINTSKEDRDAQTKLDAFEDAKVEMAGVKQKARNALRAAQKRTRTIEAGLGNDVSLIADLINARKEEAKFAEAVKAADAFADEFGLN